MRETKQQKSLFWHLFPTYLLISLLSLFAVGWYTSKTLRNFFLDQIENDLKAKAYLISKQIEPHLMSRDILAIDSICKNMGREIATRITIILPTGRVIGDSDENPGKMENHANRPEIRKALNGSAGSSIRYSNTLHQRMMYVAVPLQKTGTIISVIRTALSVSAIDDVFRRLQASIVWGGLVIGLFAALFSFIASRYISRPIQEIKKGAEHFARGDFQYQLPYAPTEELNSLSDSLNQMALQLEERMQTISHQRNELEAVLSGMVEGVLAIDKDERVLSVNRAAAEIFESRPEKIQGRLIQEVIRNVDLQNFVKQALANEAHRINDISLFKDSERIINAYCSSLTDAEGLQIGSLLVLNDVTHLRRLENIRRDFVANVSHEIKTPLTAIKGFVETLHNGDVDEPEEAERFLGIIAKHVDRLNAIVEDLLSLSRIEQEEINQELSIEKTRLLAVIKTAIQICQTKADEKNISLNLICDNDLSAEIDATQFEQVAVNLIDNAVKFSPPNSIVQIEALGTADGTVIHFKDQGIGIPQKHLSRLFERFYRVDKARSRELGGTGLGLAIVKHIVQAHNGNVNVESTPGHGSIFSIHLPNKQ